MSMKEEIEMGRVNVKSLGSLFPRMDICYGNHDLRAYKAVKEKGIIAEMLYSLSELYRCPPGWRFDYEFRHEGVSYFHGDGYSGQKGALEAAMKRRGSVVIGHLHSFGGIHYHNNGQNQIFGLNVGCLIDASLPAFNYAATAKDKPTLGCGVVIEGGQSAYFVPMEV